MLQVRLYRHTRIAFYTKKKQRQTNQATAGKKAEKNKKKFNKNNFLIYKTLNKNSHAAQKSGIFLLQTKC